MNNFLQKITALFNSVWTSLTELWQLALPAVTKTLAGNLPLILIGVGCLLLLAAVILLITLRRSRVRAARAARAAVTEPAESAESVESVEEAEEPVRAVPEQPSTEERFRRLEEIIQVQEQQIAAMGAQLEDAAKLRHDFRQELLLLRAFARDGDREALARYLPEIKLEGRGATLPLCTNPPINTMLRHYFDKARAAGIEVDAAVEADETLWLPAGDVGILFGNLLENAVTAASEAPEGQRRIRLRTAQTRDIFVIAMGNTFGAPRVCDSDGMFSSSKADHAGIGLHSIRSLALQYEGEAKFLVDGEMFMSYVILLRPNDA